MCAFFAYRISLLPLNDFCINKEILILVERQYADVTAVFSSTRISINGIKIRTVSRAKIHNILN